jgi:proliferating cell nuclear antigen
MASTHCLEIRTVQAVAVKILVEALKELLTDTCIEFDETGLKVVAMDTSHVVLVHLKLEASKFELYHCQGRISIGVNMLNLHKLIKTINNNDTLTLFIDKDDMNHLCIKIENSDKNSRTTYNLNLLDLDHQNISVDPTDFTEVVTLPSVDFQKICRDMHNLADHMEIKSIHNQLIFSCKGDFCSQETIICDNDSHCGAALDAALAIPDPTDPAAPVEADEAVMGAATSSQYATTDMMVSAPSLTGTSALTHPVQTAGAGGRVRGGGIVQGVFSVKHLVLFTKCTNLSNTMELYLKNDYPLIIKYDVASLGSIKLALAPKQ